MAELFVAVDAGDILRIALIAVAANALIIVISNVLALGVVYEIVTPWVEAGSDASSNLIVVGAALSTMSLVIRVIGDAIDLGIGNLLFSIAILKTGLAPKWIGPTYALGGLLGRFVSISDISGLFGLIGAVALFIWLITLGATMVRAED